ncbi:M20 family metallopeptidase [Halomarina litorea]|uniref:M20 family metallopeptidase n=1 Tax=Halomarina litorea TaxID=2961595 RepID=UPI0020C560F2|nr:M20/M25/M40 family metallo-hydrolase [Halomarina sp. BCD28]
MSETELGIDPRTTIDLLQDLVRIPSPYFEEAEISEFVYEWLDERGLDPEYHHVSEPQITGYEGDNVVARLEGSDPEAPTLLLNAHVDTVKLVEAWEEDPCSGRIEDGKLYGQGACDMKGGLAAVMVAFEALAESDLSGDVLLTAVVDEEGPYGLGADALIRDGYTDDCDAAIVTEPGPVLAQSDVENPALILGARGRYLYDVEVTGRAAHGSQPGKGVNAVVDAGRVAEALSEMAVDSHPDLGDGSVCPLLLEGGSQTLSVPESARLMVDRHVVPGETKAVVREQAESVVADLNLASDVEIGFREAPAEDIYYGPYVTSEDHSLVRSLADATNGVTGVDPDVAYFSSVGDFNYFGDRAGLPTVIVGPDGENIHSAGEFVYTDEVVEVARIVAGAARTYLG